MYLYIYYTVKMYNFLWFDFILPQGFAFDNNFLLNIYSYILPLVNQLSNRLIVIWYYIFLQFGQFYNTNLVLFFYSLWSYFLGFIPFRPIIVKTIFSTFSVGSAASVSVFFACDKYGVALARNPCLSRSGIFNTPLIAISNLG